MSLKARRIAQTHKLLGLVVGFQLLFWTASGLFFTLFPIEQIRGEHLREASAPVGLSSLQDMTLPEVTGEVRSVELRQVLGRVVWQVETPDGGALFDAETGMRLDPFGKTEVRRLAETAWAGEGAIASLRKVERPPREAFTGKPLWRVEFQGRDEAVFWVDAERARITAVRTDKWRVFDVLWRFHIMDVTGEDRFDSWWLKVFAFLGLSTVLFGFALLVHRASKGRLFR